MPMPIRLQLFIFVQDGRLLEQHLEQVVVVQSAEPEADDDRSVPDAAGPAATCRRVERVGVRQPA